jgi:microcystin-dependent protein
MANYEATRYDFDGANLTGIEGVNTGIVVPWGSASIPTGFLLCDGTSYDTTTYAALFAVIAYTYGGSGANFNVPDLRDRTVVGVSAANSKTLAQGIGANTVTPTGNVGGNAASTTLTTQQIAAHTHTAGVAMAMSGFMCSGPNQFASSMNTGSAGGGQGHTHTLSATFTGSANSVLQPGLVLNYIIKT